MCQSVAECYAGKSIFITGCTGFLGKVLLEKILYSCSDVKKVYILLRGKRGLTIQERVKTLLELPVSYVFHSAASIKFTEPLHDLLNVNVKGTERVLSLCKCMKKLEVLVHVSTAYSNTHKIFIEEKVYPSPIPLSMIDHLIKEQPDEERTKIIIKDESNAYTFSKKLGEALLAEKHGHVPVIIIRPSIVTASLSEPLPGWIDNWNGATGLIGSISKGILRVIPGNEGNVLDLIPVDYVVNLIIVAPTKKILYRKILRRIVQVRDVLEIFTSNSWKFSTMNNYCLFSSLSPSDQKTFPFSPSLINWSEYIPIYFDGMIKYLLKTNPAS
ncbi:fatty acyl-CoA reductase 1-like [Pieris brassicae]|uniref:fatty acyl-CoA reductase 1-like n=1 Tax=Pieris brassicae TaxID=7116 RepID=UPI001E65F43C|nr:fatty acyl-CoA reductase 1-like [Pieris brassicae]